jgi:DNA-binding transcriptional MocR family regulator
MTGILKGYDILALEEDSYGELGYEVEHISLLKALDENDDYVFRLEDVEAIHITVKYRESH